MMAVSDLAIVLIFATLILSYLFCSRQRAFYYTIAVSLNLFMMSIGKMAYHNPRPYMVDDDIQVYGCSTEFGHPSGHTFGSSALIMTMLLDILS